jgi:hypothetical protein
LKTRMMEVEKRMKTNKMWWLKTLTQSSGIYLLDYMRHPASNIDPIIKDDKPVIDPFDDDEDNINIVPQDNESPKEDITNEDQDEFDEDEEAPKLERMLSSSPDLTHHYSSSSSSRLLLPLSHQHHPPPIISFHSVPPHPLPV